MTEAAAWPANKIVRRKVADLVAYARNARTHSDAQVEEIAASMRAFGWTVPLLIDPEGGIIAGHGRVMAAEKLGIKRVPCMIAEGWSPEQKAAYILADNKIPQNAGWDVEMLRLELGELKVAGFDLDLTGFAPIELNEIFPEGAQAEAAEVARASLAELFMLPPFSVLNAREGWWQARKRAWIALGIQSELGRGETGSEFHAILGGSPMVAGYTEEGERLTGLENIIPSKTKLAKKKASAIPGGGGDAWLGGAETASTPKFKKGKARAVTTTEWVKDHGLRALAQDGPAGTGTSIFDPVLAELAYSWFSPPGGSVLDPFAGGSVRGVVASKLGRNYTGIELRAEQVAANRIQGKSLCQDCKPRWYQGDSREMDKLLPKRSARFDFLFSCPPYADLEVYSDGPTDLSTMPYPVFQRAYREIIARACDRLANDRFACFVVGEVRGKGGGYRNFVGETVEAFKRAGLDFYNEAILVTSVGSLPIRVAKQFSGSRKLGKTHQNVLVFCKGDGKAATEVCGPVEVFLGEEIQEETANADTQRDTDSQAG